MGVDIATYRSRIGKHAGNLMTFTLGKRFEPDIAPATMLGQLPENSMPRGAFVAELIAFVLLSMMAAYLTSMMQDRTYLGWSHKSDNFWTMDEDCFTSRPRILTILEIMMLLFIGGVEFNPGPRPESDIGFACHGLNHLPTGYVTREEQETAVLDLLSRTNSVGIVSAQGIYGIGGVGKTYLAQAVAWKMRSKIEVAFVEVGTNPDVLSIVNNRLYPYLENDEKGNFTGLEDAWTWLSRLTRQRKVLIILDDVWSEPSTIQVLRQLREALYEGSQILYTTRSKDILSHLKASPYELDVINIEDRWEFVLKCADINMDNEQMKASKEKLGTEIEKCIDGLPIVLDNFAQHVKLEMSGSSGRSFQDKLQMIKREVRENPEWLERSFNALKPVPSDGKASREWRLLPTFLTAKADLNRVQQLCLLLGVFKDDERFRLSVIASMYHLCVRSDDDVDAPALASDDLTVLVNNSLIRVVDEQDGDRLYTMHDIVREYVITKGEGISGLDESFRYESELHKLMLEAFKKKVDPAADIMYAPWFDLDTSEEYFYEKAAFHFEKGGFPKVYINLLTRYEWLNKKINVTPVANILSDFRVMAPYVADDNILFWTIYDNLNLSKDALAINRSQMTFQLIGRLKDHPSRDIMDFIERIPRDCLPLAPVSLCLVPPGGGRKEAFKHPGTVLSLAVPNNGGCLYTGCNDGVLRVCDFESGIKRMVGLNAYQHKKSVWAVGLDTEHRHLVTVSLDHTIKVWTIGKDGEKFDEPSIRKHADQVYALAIFPDGRHFATGSADNTIRFWTLDDPEEVLPRLNKHTGTVRSLCVSQSGDKLISASEDGAVCVWDWQRRAEYRTFLRPRPADPNKVATKALCACLSRPNGASVIAGYEDGIACVWHIEKSRCRTTNRKHVDEIFAVSSRVYVEDGREKSVFFTAGDDWKILMWDFKSLDVLAVLHGHSGRIRTILITPDNKYMITSSEDQHAIRWDLDKIEAKSLREQHELYVSSVAITEDGAVAVTGSLDGTLKLWNAQDGNFLKNIESPHDDKVTKVIIEDDPSSREQNREFVVVSGSEDRSIKVWRVSLAYQTAVVRQHAHHVLRGHSFAVKDICLTSDKKSLISGSSGGEIIKWSLEDGAHMGVVISPAKCIRKVHLSGENDQRIILGLYETSMCVHMEKAFSPFRECPPGECKHKCIKPSTITTAPRTVNVPVCSWDKGFYFPLLENGKVGMVNTDDRIEGPGDTAHGDPRHFLITALKMVSHEKKDYFLSGTDIGNVLLLRRDDMTSAVAALSRPRTNDMEIEAKVTSLSWCGRRWNSGPLCCAGFENGDVCIWQDINIEPSPHGKRQSTQESVEARHIYSYGKRANVLAEVVRHEGDDQRVIVLSVCVAISKGDDHHLMVHRVPLDTSRKPEILRNLTLSNEHAPTCLLKLPKPVIVVGTRTQTVWAYAFQAPQLEESQKLQTVHLNGVRSMTATEYSESQGSSKTMYIFCTAGFDNLIQIWNTITWQAMKVITVDGFVAPREISFSDTGMTTLRAFYDCYNFVDFEVDINSPYPTAKCKNSIFGIKQDFAPVMALAANGNHISEDIKLGLKAWDVYTGEEYFTVSSADKHTKNLTSMANMTEDTFVTSAYDTTLKIWKICTDAEGECSVKLLHQVHLDHAATAMAFCKSSNRLVLGLHNGDVAFIRVDSWLT